MLPTMWSSLDKSKNPTDEDLNKIQSYIFCKWLSGDYRTIYDANIFNLYNIPVKNQYFYIKHKHAGNIRNIKYIKSNKDDINIDVNNISNFYKVNLDKAREYLEFISQDELLKLREIYRQGVK